MEKNDNVNPLLNKNKTSASASFDLEDQKQNTEYPFQQQTQKLNDDTNQQNSVENKEESQLPNQIIFPHLLKIFSSPEHHLNNIEEPKRRYSDYNIQEQVHFIKIKSLQNLIEMGFEYQLVEIMIDKILEKDTNYEIDTLCTQVANQLAIQQEEFEKNIPKPLNLATLFDLSNHSQIPDNPIQRIYSLGVNQMGQRQSLRNQSQIQNQEDQKECSICGEVDQLKKSSLNCACLFCPLCLEFYIISKMKEGVFAQIRCPGESCDTELNNNDIQLMLKDEIYAEFKKYYDIFTTDKDINVGWCPTCFQKVIRQNKKQKTAQCPSCQNSMCFQCKKTAHGKKSCNQTEQDLFDKAKKLFEIKDCPNCKKPIQKSSGCNHMTCVQCKHEFCWLCSKIYSYSHYQRWNLCGCPGSQYANGVSRRKCNFLLNFFLYYILCPILIIAVSSVVFALYHLYMPIKYSYRFYKDEIMDCCGGCLYNNGFRKIVFLFIFIIISLPFSLIIAIIPGYYTQYYKKYFKKFIGDFYS